MPEAGRDPMAYLSRRRRMLLDMHIPDWDEGFLARYDPAELARCYELAGVNAVMLYCKSHMGLAYWPTTAGQPHRGVRIDAVGELVRLLHERDILACGYTSVSYDHHAVAANPDWSVAPPGLADRETVTPWPRHSVVCLSRQDYVEYEKALIGELLEAYPFDAFFLDMAYWPDVCVCDSCRQRFAAEDGGELPSHVDWADPEWVRFQRARERWADELMQQLLTHARSLVDVPVYHNFAVSFAGWAGGTPLESFRADAFLGADLTGGRDEQLFAMKLMRAVSPNLPAEYMTPRAPTLDDHVSVKPEQEMTLQALGAVALDSAVLFIDAIDAEGTVNTDLYRQVGRVNQRIASYEELSGGEHVQDVGVYFSSHGYVDLRRNGSSVAAALGDESPYLDGAVGAIRLLQQAHVAAGVVTYRQLDQLPGYKVLVVPELGRMTPDEVAALRGYVEGGGSLYVSGRTSLLDVAGVAHSDFLLADVLGVNYAGDEPGAYLFSRPAAADVAQVIAPQKFLGWPLAAPWAARGAGALGAPPRVAAGPAADVLATLSLPYGYPVFGTHKNQDWASVYGAPPWTHTGHPTLVEHAFGAGRAVYSTLPLERDTVPAGRALFTALVRRLLGERATVWSDCHPAVWLEAFHQPEQQRYVVNLLNYPADLHPFPVDVAFSLRLPDGMVQRRAVRVELFERVVVEYGGGR